MGIKTLVKNVDYAVFFRIKCINILKSTFDFKDSFLKIITSVPPHINNIERILIKNKIQLYRRFTKAQILTFSGV